MLHKTFFLTIMMHIGPLFVNYSKRNVSTKGGQDFACELYGCFSGQHTNFESHKFVMSIPVCFVESVLEMRTSQCFLVRIFINQSQFLERQRFETLKSKV